MVSTGLWAGAFFLEQVSAQVLSVELAPGANGARRLTHQDAGAPQAVEGFVVGAGFTAEDSADDLRQVGVFG